MSQSEADVWALDQVKALRADLTPERAEALIVALSGHSELALVFWGRRAVEADVGRALSDEEWVSVQSTKAWGSLPDRAFRAMIGRGAIDRALDEAGIRSLEESES